MPQTRDLPQTRDPHTRDLPKARDLAPAPDQPAAGGRPKARKAPKPPTAKRPTAKPPKAKPPKVKPDTPGAPEAAKAPAAPDGPAPYVPYYARNMYLQREREAIVRLVNRFGTHLICGRKTCRRAHTCTDKDPRTLPRCFWQHRGAIRMIAMAAIERAGLKDAKRPDEGPNPPPLPPMDRDEPTVLGMMRDKGRPIHLLEKPHDAGEDPWCHEYHPHAVETFRRLVGRKPA